MRKIIVVGIAGLLASAGVCARPRDFYAGAEAHPVVVAQTAGASTVVAPPPMGNFDPTAAIAALGGLKSSLDAAGAWTQWANDAIVKIASQQAADEAAIANWTAVVGPAGPAGADATVQVGTVSTGAPGSAVVVTNSGTPGAAVLNFSIPQGATGLPGPQAPPAFTPYAVPTGFVIPVIADQMAGGCLFTGGKCTGWTSIKGGGLYGQELIFGGTAGDSGSFYDYSIVVPQAGNYGVSANVAITTGTSSFSGHFECPVGTPIGSMTYTNAGLTNPANPFVAKIASVSLPAGPQTLRFVLDAAPAGNSSGMVNWYYFAKLP